jgi:hypothetical protein
MVEEVVLYMVILLMFCGDYFSSLEKKISKIISYTVPLITAPLFPFHSQV